MSLADNTYSTHYTVSPDTTRLAILRNVGSGVIARVYERVRTLERAKLAERGMLESSHASQTLKKLEAKLKDLVNAWYEIAGVIEAERIDEGRDRMRLLNIEDEKLRKALERLTMTVVNDSRLRLIVPDLASGAAPVQTVTRTAPGTNGQKRKPVKPTWDIPNLPSRLRKFAETMIALNCRAGTDTLREPLGFDPARIFHDYKKPRLKKWVATHVEKEDTGIYRFSPKCKALTTGSKSSQKRNVKVSK